MKNKVYLDTFSGSIIDLKRGQRSDRDVLAALQRDPMVSTWDMSDHAWIRNTIMRLIRDGMIEDLPQEYPWCRFKLTDKGRAMLNEVCRRCGGEMKPGKAIGRITKWRC